MTSAFEQLVTRVRDHYLEQFWDLADERRKQSTEGTAELKIRMNGTSDLYESLWCADYVTRDENGEIQVIEFAVDKFLMFDPVEFDCGRAALLVDHLRWDDVVIEHDLPDVSAEEIEAWFNHWFDPEDAAMRQTEIIHSLQLRSGRVGIDMGTAPPAALYGMLELLERAGARRLRITASQAEPEN